MNDKFCDANLIYDAGTRAIKSSSFKYPTQLFEQNHLLETAHIQQGIRTRKYKPKPGDKFPISERGKTRYISNNVLVDKAVNHLLCDEVLTPAVKPYLQYDNMASQKNKGVDKYRERLERHLHEYFNEYGTNEGYILTVDLSGYYANIPHDKCKEVCGIFLDKAKENPETIETAKWLINLALESMKMDVSRFSDDEIKEMYNTKVDSMMNFFVDPKLLTGEKWLHKGVDIGNQDSQDIGILYPYRLDNYIKIVEGFHGWGRYTDDFYIISPDKMKLKFLLGQIKVIAKEYGLIINEKKTHILDLSKPFRHLQEQWWLTETGKVIRKISGKSITRERRKLKAYKRLLNVGKITLDEVANSFKSWIGKHWKIMSWQQIYSMYQLYLELFNKPITWKKGHGRLKFMMNHKPNKERMVKQ